MDGQNLKSFLKKLLSEGKVKQALSYVLTLSDTEKTRDLHDYAINLSSRHKRYENQRRLSTGKKEDLEREINKINFDLLQLINDIPEGDDIFKLDILAKEETEKKEDARFTENQELSFLQWLSKKSRIGIPTIFAVIGMLGFIAGFITIVNGIQSISNDSIYYGMNAFACCGNLILAAIAAFSIKNITQSKESEERLNSDVAPEDNENSNDSSVNYFNRAKDAVKEFKWCWNLVWIGFLLLYGTFFYTTFYADFADTIFSYPSTWKSTFKESIEEKKYIFQLLEDIWTHISSLGFIMCFSILFYKNPDPGKKHYENPITTYSFFILIIFILIEVFAIFFFESTDNLILFKIITGIISSVSIALLIGRLDSRFLNISIWFILTMFIYASIQLLPAYFDLYSQDASNNLDLSSVVESFALNFALFSKAVFFLLIYWLINEGKLMRYIIHVNNVIDDIASSRK